MCVCAYISKNVCTHVGMDTYFAKLCVSDINCYRVLCWLHDSTNESNMILVYKSV